MVDSTILSKIKGCSEDLDEWGSRLWSRFKKSICEYMEEMRLNQDNMDELCVKKYNEAQENLSKVLKQEEDYWRQRSKTYWLWDGDSNTKFFHAKVERREMALQRCKMMTVRLLTTSKVCALLPRNILTPYLSAHGRFYARRVQNSPL
jgi:hypothetical protein